MTLLLGVLVYACNAVYAPLPGPMFEMRALFQDLRVQGPES